MPADFVIKIVGADNGRVATGVAAAEPTLFKHGDVGDAVFLGKVVGGASPWPPAPTMMTSYSALGSGDVHCCSPAFVSTHGLAGQSKHRIFPHHLFLCEPVGLRRAIVQRFLHGPVQKSTSTLERKSRASYASVSHPPKRLLPFCDGIGAQCRLIQNSRRAICRTGQNTVHFHTRTMDISCQLSDNGHGSLRWMTVAKSGLLSHTVALVWRAGLNENRRDTG